MKTAAPKELQDKILEESKVFIKKSGRFSNTELSAKLAIAEWRLQEMGYTLWPTE